VRRVVAVQIAQGPRVRGGAPGSGGTVVAAVVRLPMDSSSHPLTKVSAPRARRTGLGDLLGIVPYPGPARTMEEMDAAILEHVRRDFR
jgi:hypothetical protein